MKIFFITNTVGEYGGSELITKNLLEELIRRGHKLFIFTTCDYQVKGAQTHAIKTFGHHAFHKFEALFYKRKALKLAKKFKPDIVHSHSNALMALIGHEIKKKLQIPHIYTLEMLSPKSKSIHGKVIFHIEKFLIPRLNFDYMTIWAQGPKDEFLIPWNIASEKVKIIPAALDLKKYRFNATGTKINKKFGSHLLTSMKTFSGLNTMGLKQVIDSMEFVAEKHPDYKYLIFGWGEGKKELKKYINSKNLNDFVLVEDPVIGDECNEVWAATEIAPHAFVFDFTIAISLLEYLAFGVPCVVTDVGNAKNLMGKVGIIVPPEKPKQMADAINKLIENPSLRKKLGLKAKELVKENYSVKNVGEQMDLLYKEATRK